MTDPDAALVDIVDGDDTVIQTVTRAEMRAKNLRHRCTYVVVMRSSGAVVVHKRADWKDIWPSRWDICFGGVVDSGETWIDAATRELAEEAGLMGAELELLGLTEYADAETNCAGRAYVVVTDDELTCPDGEVVELAEVDVDDLDAWIAGHAVCSDSALTVAPLIADWTSGDVD